MDIAGAKALRRRLGSARTSEQAAATLAVSELAPPLYRWFGIERRAPLPPAARRGAERRRTAG